MFCHGCGTQVNPDLQFCPNCGRSLAVTPGVATPPVGPWIAPAGIQARPGQWIGQGWELVKADMITFFLVALVMTILSGVVPIILQGPLMAGFHIFCVKKLLNRRAEFADLFTGFNYFIPTLVASLIISLFISIGVVLCVIPGLVVAAMYNFTYLFIVDKRMDFWPAMQSSHALVKNDYFGFSMFMLLIVLVDLLGVVCCILGLFIAMPVTVAAITIAYRDLVGFEPRTLQELGTGAGPA